jgi:hypothetical protein
MTPSERTPQERDRRFARVRLATQSILMGSLAASLVFVGYASSISHVAVATTVAPPTTTIPATTIPAKTVTTRPSTVVSAAPPAYYGDDSGGDDGYSNVSAGAPAVQTTPAAVQTTPAAVKTTTVHTPPSTAPVKAAPVCTTTPSGRMVCH